MIDRLQTALTEFVNNESELLIQDAHEGSITGCLIEYLAAAFDDLHNYDIDTQYNRRFVDNVIVAKQMEFLASKLPADKLPSNWDNKETVVKNILPDIIFHERGSHTHNYIAIEVKKSTNKNASDREWDLIKLEAMTSRDLNYQFGVFVEFTTGVEFNKAKPYSLTVFVNGKVVLTD